MDSGQKLQALYDTEINFSISTFWDAGFLAKLGDPVNVWTSERECRTREEAADWRFTEAKMTLPTTQEPRMTPLDEAVTSFNALAHILSLDSSGVLNQAAAIAAAVFKAGIDAGVDAREMAGRLGPGLSCMQAARARFSLTASDTTVSILSFYALVSSNATLDEDVAALIARLEERAPHR